MSSPYEIRFVKALQHDWFTVCVLYGGEIIAEKSVCRSFRRAGRWARGRIKDHSLALERLGYLHAAAPSESREVKR